MAPLLPIKKRPSYRLLQETRPLAQLRGATRLQAFTIRTSMADDSERSFTFSSKESRARSNITHSVEKRKTGLTVSLKENEEPNESSNNHQKACICLQGPKVGKKKTGALILQKRRWTLGGNSNWVLGETSQSTKPRSPPPKVPSQLEKRIKAKGGRDIQLVIRKKITETDLSKQQGRLLIPWQQIREDACFLTEGEEGFLNSERKEKGKNEVRVMVMEPCGVDSEMALVKWSMQSSENYVLRTGWNDAVKRNHKKEKHLEVDQFIQLWSFRVGPQLWFAIDVGIPSSSDKNPDTCVELEDQPAEKD